MPSLLQIVLLISAQHVKITIDGTDAALYSLNLEIKSTIKLVLLANVEIFAHYQVMC